MNPMVMNALDWWARLDWRRWFPPVFKVVVVVTLAVSGVWLWVKWAQWRRYSIESIEATEEIERAKIENVTEGGKWMSLPPREFQDRVMRYFETVQRETKSRLPSVNPYPTTGFGEVDPAMWRTSMYAINVGGSPHQVLSFFQMMRSEPLVVEVVGLKVFRPEQEDTKELAATAVVKVAGMGWPIQPVPGSVSPSLNQRLEGYSQWFADPKSEVVVVIQRPKPQPAWKLTGLAGRSVYLSMETTGEKKILGHGEVLYGWTIEISDGMDAAEAVILKKGRTILKWTVGSFFDGLEVNKR